MGCVNGAMPLFYHIGESEFQRSALAFALGMRARGETAMNMQVENMPEDLRERLRRPASKRGSAVSEVVISLIEKELDHDDRVENLRERPRDGA